MIMITRIKDFEAAHFLPNYCGKCQRIHGHSYRAEVTVSGYIFDTEGDPKEGMVMDFHDLDSAMEKVFDRYDHYLINDFIEIPTAENMVCDIAEKLNLLLPEEIILEEVKLWETRKSYATWKR